jgi:hypothetical protein
MDEHDARGQRHPDDGRPPRRPTTSAEIPARATRDDASPEGEGRQAMVEARQLGGQGGVITPAADDMTTRRKPPPINQDELAHLPILKPGTQLEQGGVYFDLANPERGQFKALGGQEAGSGNRYLAKRDIDHELWNRLVEQDRGVESAPPLENPRSAAEAIEALYERGEHGVGIDR